MSCLNKAVADEKAIICQAFTHGIVTASHCPEYEKVCEGKLRLLYDCPIDHITQGALMDGSEHEEWFMITNNDPAVVRGDRNLRDYDIAIEEIIHKINDHRLAKVFGTSIADFGMLETSKVLNNLPPGRTLFTHKGQAWHIDQINGQSWFTAGVPLTSDLKKPVVQIWGNGQHLARITTFGLLFFTENPFIKQMARNACERVRSCIYIKRNDEVLRANTIRVIKWPLSLLPKEP